jgi:RNA polymerase sigma-70 factor (ECF subfamily)
VRAIPTTERTNEVTEPTRRALRVVPETDQGPAPSPRGSETRCDEAGLREAFLVHGGELLGFARRSLRGGSAAEDAVQETFARAWRSRARFDPSLGTLRSWLFAIERRVLIDTVVRQAKHDTDLLEEGVVDAAEDGIDAALSGWQLAAALERLDPAHRLVLTELYFNGRSSREVASLFGIPEGTVRSRAFYALRSMRAVLDEVGWTP